ncbi:MAG: glycosyltransferase family 41 protein [Aquabacterium sp.]|uniref:tetratricopeptide repeat protein n=1 Tax=Aquabacterium sp. TaxID=1872578 RepID=UPI00120EFE06|nr:glycosyltransferase family 41 protein [Aquabacterium sp.]TAK96200.1 MAG: glycosyltransferase family 41 protein [Aquabacterium sp.]
MKNKKNKGPVAVSASQVLPQADGGYLIALFNAGRYADLEARARQLSVQYPSSGFVWKVLGTALLVQNKDGLEALQNAVALLPGDAEALSNLGNVQKAQGLVQEAAASYEGAVAIRPDFVAAHYNLGIALKELGQTEKALASYRQAIALLPGFVEAHFNLGIALKDLERRDEAMASYRQAIALKPDYAEAHYNLAVALKEAGQLDEAVRCYRQAIACKPDYADAHCNLGVALEAMGQLNEAVASYRQAITLQPGMAAAHNNLGNVLKDLGRYEAALGSLQEALRLKPDFADACNNLGNAFKDLGRLDEALQSYRRALALDPDATDVLGNVLFTSNYLAGQTPDELLVLARQYGEVVQRKAYSFTNWSVERDVHRPLRVGIVSGDLCLHPVGYFVEGVLRALKAQSADSIALFAYATHVRHDALSERIKACCVGWCQATTMSDQALAQRIHADRIDILIDLSGHTAHNRLPMFAWKPAPVQVSWLGYFATTGVAAMDYFVADPWTLPESEGAPFTEQIWRLPETRLCFTEPAVDVAVSPLPALQNGHITFGCFNNLTKMNDEVVSLWARVLKAVDGSQLMLKAEQLDDPGVCEMVKARFADQGVASDRLVLEGRSNRTDYLARYGHIDIALDPFPFTGGTTSAESLWMGVPVLTLAGERLVSRQGVGLLMNAGLPEWVATDADDYVAKAVAHARDLMALSALRAGLRKQVLASPVFDAARFAQHFELALRGMWARWCQQATQG